MEKVKKKSSARKTSENPTKVYAYGAFSPKDLNQLNVINTQLKSANVYRNKLVEIERKRRNRFRQLRTLMAPDQLIPLNESLTSIDEQILLERKNLGGYAKGTLDPLHPKKNRNESEVSIKIKELRALKKNISLQIKSIHDSLNKEFFSSADDKFKLLKKERLEHKAIELNKPALGPNDPIAHQIVEDLYQELISEGNRFWAIKAKISKSAKNSNKRARANRKCSPGTGGQIEEAARKSFADSKFEPHFKKFDGTGKLSIQLTGKDKGLPIIKALNGSDSNIKIELHPDVKLRDNKKKKKIAATARIKLFGTEKSGTFIDVPFLMHRSMPEDSIIKFVHLVANKIGYRTVYEIQFTIESSTFKHVPAIRNDVIAINLGWRIKNNNDILFATTYDGNKIDTKVLSAKSRSNKDYAERMLGHADDHFNSTKKELSAWIKSAAITDDLKNAVENIGHWKNYNKLFFVCNKFSSEFLPNNMEREYWVKWKNYCFESNPKLDLFTTNINGKQSAITFIEFTKWCVKNDIKESNCQMALYLKIWKEKHIHLTNWARSIETNIRRGRREIYRVFAKELYSKYGKVVVEKWNKSKTAKKPEVESDNRTEQQINSNAVRQFVGVSVLTDALKQKFSKDYFEEEPDGISTIHHSCKGKLISSDKGDEFKCCDKCNKTLSVDYNAAKILYDRYCERLGGDEKPGPARKTSKQTKSLKKKVDKSMMTT